MIRTGEVSRMRTVANLALPKSATIKRPSKSDDGMGRKSETYAAHLSAVPARVDDPGDNPAVAQLGAQIGNRQAFIVILPAGTDIQRQDHIEIDGATYEVLAILSGASWEIMRDVAAVKL